MKLVKLPLILTKRMLAEILSISIRTLERRRADGALPPPLNGLKHPRWSSAAVVEWLKPGDQWIPSQTEERK